MICPACGKGQTPMEFKMNGFDGDGNLIEQYHCYCGAWFSVVVFDSESSMD